MNLYKDNHHHNIIISILWPFIILSIIIINCHQNTMVLASRYYSPPPKPEVEKAHRLKLNLGLHVPPIILRMPRVELPQLVIGANFIKNPKAKPLVVSLPPPPTLSFDDSYPAPSPAPVAPPPPPPPKPTYDASGYGYAASNPIGNVQKAPEFSYDMKAYGSMEHRNLLPPPPNAVVVPPPPVPAPGAVYVPPPSSAMPQPYMYAPPQTPVASIVPPPPPAPQPYALPQPQPATYLPATPPAAYPAYQQQAVVAPPQQPISSPTNPIQSYPVQQHYYYPYAHYPPPGTSTATQQYDQYQGSASLEQDYSGFHRSGLVAPSSMKALTMAEMEDHPIATRVLPPSPSTTLRGPPMHQKSPFHLVKKDNKLRIKANELYDEEVINEAQESSEEHSAADDLSSAYQAAPKIPMARFQSRT